MPKICKRHCLLKALVIALVTCSVCWADEPFRQESVDIPMRDGITLKTHLLIPTHKEGPTPCILIRTPGPLKQKAIYKDMVKWGYTIAIQCTRSFHYPGDNPEPYFADGWGTLQDGYDTIQWLGESEHTNGQIGTFGESANGITQLLLAPTKPKHLKCQFIRVATPTLYQHGVYIGGKLCKHQIECWFSKVAPKAYALMLNNPEYNSFWEQIDISQKSNEVATPAIHIGGWYDMFSQGTIDSFTAWQENGAEGAKGEQKLIMGPWIHWGSHLDKLGAFEVPAAAHDLNEKTMIKSWFDMHLKGDASFNQAAAVQYFVMGPLDGTASKGNQWKSANSWPPKSSETKYYLGDMQTLSSQEPKFLQKTYAYTHDPADPVPTHGGRNLYLASGPFDQTDNEKRLDVTTFTTDTLKKDTEVTGRIRATIYISSSAPTSDVALTLTDVYPNGQSVLISEGIQAVKVVPGQVNKVEVDLWSTSMVFAKGHKIRLSIAGSNYPHFDKNENKSDNVIHVGSQYPSQVTLPITLD